MARRSRPDATDSRATVVLVDDHPVFRQGLRAIIDEDERFRVVAEAGCGYEAIFAAEQYRPDVIVLDYQLPGLTGLVIAPILARRSPESRIVFLSAYDDDHNIRDAMDAGAAAYVTKGQDPGDLLRVLSAVVSGDMPIVRTVAQQAGLVSRRAIDPSAPNATRTSACDEREIELEPLTAREITVLDCVVQGHRYRECAENLFISEATVKNNIANVLSKWGLNNRVHLFLYAVLLGWIQISATHTEEPRGGYTRHIRGIS